jgi:hypothetical protein
MNIERSAHGYSMVQFIDAAGSECVLQDSSLASEDCCWFGVCHPSGHRSEPLARMHLTVEMARQVARAMCAALEKRPFGNGEFVDRYGSVCTISEPEGARSLISVGVTTGFERRAGRPMQLDEENVRRLMPFLLGFLATGSISGEGGASELDDPEERVLDVKVPTSMLDRTDIAESGVSAQELIDAFMRMHAYYGDDLASALGHDNATRIGHVATRIGHLAKR